jgi:hypothetical protein
MTFYHDNRLTMMGLDSSPLDFLYAPSSSKRTYSEMSQGEMMSPSWLDFHNVGLASSSSSGELQQVNGFQGGSGETYYLSNPQGGVPSNEDVSLPANYEHEIPGLDSAANEATGHDTTDIAPGASSNTGAEYGLAAGEGSRTIFKQEEEETQVSLTPYGGSEYDESEYDGRRRSKVPKLNKDGIPRKPRQPRPKLLKWDDNDWKNVALGLVWACGENGIQIPFDQASQVVSESCTAGALQQALLKLRGKQIAEGFQIPSLRMAWTRKNKNGTFTTSTANPNLLQGTEKNLVPKKRPTRFIGTQTHMVVLKRAYIDADRVHLAFPHNLTSAQRVNEATQQVHEAAQQVHEVAQQANEVSQQVNETAHQATAMSPVSPMGTLNRGFLQAASGFAFQPSLGYPMATTNATTGAFYHDPQLQTSPGTGPFDQPFRMPIAPARLGTVYEENEDEHPLHGLPMSPTPNAFGAARRHRRNAPSILNMASLSGATVPSNASYSSPATPLMFGRIKLGDQNVVWGKGIVDESGIINANHAIPVPNYKGTSHMIGFNNEFRRDGPGGGDNGTSDNANSSGSNSHGGGMVH